MHKSRLDFVMFRTKNWKFVDKNSLHRIALPSGDKLQPNLSNVPRHTTSPYQFFKLHFNDDVWNLICSIINNNIDEAKSKHQISNNDIKYHSHVNKQQAEIFYLILIYLENDYGNLRSSISDNFKAKSGTGATSTIMLDIGDKRLVSVF